MYEEREKKTKKTNKVKSVKVVLVLSAQPSQSVTGAGRVFMPTYGFGKRRCSANEAIPDSQ